MDAWIRQVKGWAEPRGWRYDGRNGVGHLRFKRDNCPEAVVVPSKQGSPRNFLNSQKTFRKLERKYKITVLNDRPEPKECERFERCPVHPATGETLKTPCLVIRCGACEAVGMRYQKRSQGRTPEEHHVTHFRKLGWVLSRRRRDDRCAECVGLPEKAEPTPIEPGSRAAGLKAYADHRREVRQRERRILRTLDRCYSQHGDGYIAGESDSAIAERCQAKLSEVAELREKHFGPIDPECARDDFAVELQALKRDCGVLQRHVLRDLELIDARINNLMRRRHIIGERSEPLQTLVSSPPPNGRGH